MAERKGWPGITEEELKRLQHEEHKLITEDRYLRWGDFDGDVFVGEKIPDDWDEYPEGYFDLDPELEEALEEYDRGEEEDDGEDDEGTGRA